MTLAPPAPTMEQLLKATEVAVNAGRSISKQLLRVGRTFPLVSDEVTFLMSCIGKKHFFEFYEQAIRRERFSGVTITLKTKDGTIVGTGTITENGETVIIVDLPEKTHLALTLTPPAA